VVRRTDAEDGSVAHSELRCDDVVFMVSGYDADYHRDSPRAVDQGLRTVADP
jgi:hypothetical protein